jgi:hypothetical protein
MEQTPLSVVFPPRVVAPAASQSSRLIRMALWRLSLVQPERRAEVAVAGGLISMESNPRRQVPQTFLVPYRSSTRVAHLSVAVVSVLAAGAVGPAASVPTQTCYIWAAMEVGEYFRLLAGCQLSMAAVEAVG